MIHRARHLVFMMALASLLITEIAPRASRGGEPSPAFKESLRRTSELRKQRRRAPVPPPVGAIVPYPLPPALIIRQKPEVHDEIEALLDLLRRSSG
jgi:hypothetical protein